MSRKSSEWQHNTPPVAEASGAKVVLLAEDEDDDVLLVQLAFQKAGIEHPLHVVQDGSEVIAYLSGEGRYANREQYPFPRLLLLDQKLPAQDGLTVLQWIRAHSDPCIRNLVVLVWSNSMRTCDAAQSYAFGAHAFLVKPASLKELHDTLRQIIIDWLEPGTALLQA